MQAANIMSRFQHISFGCALLDSTLTIKQINPKFAAILQASEGELIGKKISGYIPEIKSLNLSKPYEYEKARTVNGQILSLDIIRIDGKNQSDWLVFCRDLTNYQQLFEQYNQLNEQIKLYNDMFNALYEGIFITDGEGITLYVNDAFLNLSGLKREDVLGRSVYYLMENKIVPNSCSAMVLLAKTTCSTINNYYQGRSCLVTGTPVFRDGKIIRVICVVRDVTELLSLKEQVKDITYLNLSYKHQLKEIEIKNMNKEIISPRSKIMRDIYDKAIKIASVDSPVLLLGETGVGKDFLAKFIHDASDRSTDGHFVKINCGAIPEQLLESELFGYEPGAFTGANKQGKAGLFELANRGTLFLDEIGDMPLSLQVKLLTTLQDKQFYRVGGTKSVNLNARIIAATNANLEKLIEENKFRRDLYYRLNVITIKIPPLRSRRDDIIPLAVYFLEEFNKQYNKTRYFSPKTFEFFLAYDWPGNIREMKNMIERLVIMSDQDCIEPGCFEEQALNDFQAAYRSDLPQTLVQTPPQEIRSLKKRLELFEACCIKEAIEKHSTLKEAADSLGIDLSTLVRKKQRYAIGKNEH